MLAGLHDRVRNRQQHPGQVSSAANGRQFIAMARHDPDSQTVSLILDTATANAAIHAISTQAADREARTRAIQQISQNLPESSYGRRNRETIAARETAIASRLRAIERAYRTAIEFDATPVPELTQILRSAGRAAERELELE
jgi:hypothetical protein